jgi:hypothetical protein
VDVLKQIQEVLETVPKILPFLQQFVIWAKKTFGENWTKVLEDAGSAFQALNEAQTADQRVAAAKALQDVFKKLNVLLIALLLSSCGSMTVDHPDLTPTFCVSDPPAGFQCVKPDKSVYFMPYNESANYTALSTHDFRAITERLIRCRENDSFPVPK